MRDPKRVLAATCLVLEAFVVFFAGLVAKDLSGLGRGTALAMFGGLAVVCLLASGLLRSRAGYWVGWVLQVLVLATGYWVTTMFFLGAVFAGLWAGALVVGDKVARERAAFAAGTLTQH